MTTFENLTTIVEKESRIRKEMERNPRIKIRPSASLHGLTILPLAPRSVAKISSSDKSSWSSLAPLDHPWLFLNSKKVFDEMLIHFRKSNDTQIETWITKTANIDSSLNTAWKAEEYRKNLYSFNSKWADRHEKSKGKWARKTEKRLTRIFERTKVFPTWNFWNQTWNFRRKLLRNKNAFETAIEL